LEAASSSQPPSPIPTQHTVDSLDHAMQQIDDIMKTDFSSTDVQTSILTDPESQYTAEPAANVDSKQPATLSPGRSSVN
jgi:hypothetical protein